MSRVGFVLTLDSAGWLGGVSYFRNLFAALRELPDPHIEPVIITRPEQTDEQLASFLPAEVLRTSLVVHNSPVWKLRRASQRYADRDYLFERFLKRNGIHLLSHSGYLGRRCVVPSMPWIPDFQELHRPEFFSPAERAARRRNVEECCQHGTVLLLSSRSALGDLRLSHVQCAERAKVLPFVADVPVAASLPTLIHLESTYNFKGPFFHLPNQFWAHKNHAVVIDALGILREHGHNLTVLATGNTSDHRQPKYLESLKELIRARDVTDRFRMLGVIPHLDLMGLMAASIAVVNPSFFEGWSTSVEEAKSLGKQIVLSDLPVHREQAPDRAFYFSPDDPNELAGCLLRAAREFDDSDDEEWMRRAQMALPTRKANFSYQFEKIVLEVIQTHEDSRFKT